VRLTRPSALFKAWLIWTIGVWALLAFVQGVPTLKTDLLVLTISAAVGALFSVSIALAFTLLRVRRSIKIGDGILGDHDYEITDQGLRERTSVNETLANWSGIKGVEKDKNFVFIELVSGSFHIIPRSSFTSIEDENCFVSAIKTYAKHKP
jgi:hypothetical protein